ncbi:hypothetical protein ACFY0F_23635 [Streptomyces sp. NPDC001544]|uniref:hypothetical protein n=1 Tax=Streptomyces sp. NPDC001544 TaxID=3364584 RepID=UPI00367AFD8B
MSTDIPTPTTTHLASLAAVLASASDRESRIRLFSELADEAFVCAVEAPTEELRQFWGSLHEGFYSDMRTLVDPPKPKRRWFR